MFHQDAAVEAWLKIVFHATDAEDLTVREIEFSATKGLTEFFVRMLRLVSQGDERTAVVELGRERKRRGFIYDLVDISPPDSPKLADRKRKNRRSRSIKQEDMVADEPLDLALPEHGAVLRSGCPPLVLDEVSEEKQSGIPIGSGDSISDVPRTDLIEDSSISTALIMGRKRTNSNRSHITGWSSPLSELYSEDEIPRSLPIDNMPTEDNSVAWIRRKSPKAKPETGPKIQKAKPVRYKKNARHLPAISNSVQSPHKAEGSRRVTRSASHATSARVDSRQKNNASTRLTRASGLGNSTPAPQVSKIFSKYLSLSHSAI